MLSRMWPIVMACCTFVQMGCEHSEEFEFEFDLSDQSQVIPNQTTDRQMEDTRFAFELKELQVDSSGKWHVGLFTFTNQGPSSILLPGFYGMPPSDGRFQPSFVEYEVKNGEVWAELDAGYDGSPRYFSLEPDETWEMLIQLSPLHQQATPLTVRVSLVDRSTDKSVRYTSEPFVVDSVAAVKQ